MRFGAAVFLAVFFIACIAPGAYAQETSPQTAESLAVAWVNRTQGRWETILGVITARIAQVRAVYEGDRDARPRIAASRAEFDQAISALRRDIDTAGPMPSAQVFEDEAFADFIRQMPDQQRAELDRLSALSALEEEKWIAFIDGRESHDVVFRIQLNSQFREVDAILLQMMHFAQFSLPPGSLAAVWNQLWEVDTRLDIASRDARIALLLDRPQDVAAIQAEARGMIAELRALAPGFRRMSRQPMPLLEGTVGAEEVARMDAFRRVFPQLPDVMDAHLVVMERGIAGWGDLTKQMVAAETGVGWLGLISRFNQVAEAASPPPT